MKIFDAIKQSIMDKINERRAKHMQHLLIKTDDDQKVVDALPADQNNSNIDIKAVVANMEEPENMREVVVNNLSEIIEQDNVRDTLKYLNDNDVLKILEENNKQLRKNEKIKFAIEAIGNNDKKMKAVGENLRELNDYDLARILDTLKPEKDENRREKIENQKIKLVSMKILEHMVNDGGVWHIKELTSSLKQESKLAVAKLCFGSIDGYEKDKKRKLGSQAKVKFMVDLFRATEVSYDQKIEALKMFENKGLNSDEIAKIKGEMEKERAKKETEEVKRQEKIRMERLKKDNGGINR